MCFRVTRAGATDGLTTPAQPWSFCYVSELVIDVCGLVQRATATVTELEPVFGQRQHERLLLFVPLDLGDDLFSLNSPDTVTV